MTDFNREIADLYPWLFKLARRYCSSVCDIEDLVGDTIYKVLSNKEKFKEGRALKPWCEVIMLNTYITAYNRRSLIRFVGCDNIKEIFSHNQASDDLMVHDIQAAIRRCHNRTCCMDCVVYYAHGYSYKEIGKMVGIPVNTVRSRISYGRELLRNELDLTVK